MEKGSPIPCLCTSGCHLSERRTSFDDAPFPCHWRTLLRLRSFLTPVSTSVLFHSPHLRAFEAPLQPEREDDDFVEMHGEETYISHGGKMRLAHMRGGPHMCLADTAMSLIRTGRANVALADSVAEGLDVCWGYDAQRFRSSSTLNAIQGDSIKPKN